MYSPFFGFAEKPFDVTPDPKFLYLSPGHRETLAALTYGIRERRGFITIVGEVGTGKTTLLNTVLGRLDENTRVGFIFNTDVAFDETLTIGLADLGLVRPEETLPKVESVRRLNDFAIHQLAQGGNVVLLVDEAQNLDRSAMESLRLLSNLETRKHKLIQIVLSGQPELDVKLNQPQLRQLTQRISLKRYIKPLTEDETYEYIEHRLRVAEYSGPALFGRRARKMIWEYSGGVPRKINVLCDNALLIAYGLQQKTIEPSVLEEAIKDLSWSPFSSSGQNDATIPVQIPPPSQGKSSYARFATAASLVFAACITFLVGLLVGASRSNWHGDPLIPLWTAFPAKPAIQLSARAGQTRSAQELAIARGRALSTPLRKEPDSPDGTTSTAPHGHHPTSIAASAGTENQIPLANSKPSTTEVGESLTRDTPVVVVRKGDNLFRIISQTYGKYDRSLLRTVLRRNPGIQNPDLILVGQVITLPDKE